MSNSQVMTNIRAIQYNTIQIFQLTLCRSADRGNGWQWHQLHAHLIPGNPLTDGFVEDQIPGAAETL